MIEFMNEVVQGHHPYVMWFGGVTVVSLWTWTTVMLIDVLTFKVEGE